ncbi:hypothetical protein CB1_001644001 [Camelus ferus]|nr:hypothetical protein CB1_001644001 [Camelus ferus]
MTVCCGKSLGPIRTPWCGAVHCAVVYRVQSVSEEFGVRFDTGPVCLVEELAVWRRSGCRAGERTRGKYLHTVLFVVTRIGVLSEKVKRRSMGPNLERTCRGYLGFESREELVVAVTGEAGKRMKGTGQECGNRLGGCLDGTADRETRRYTIKETSPTSPLQTENKEIVT